MNDLNKNLTKTCKVVQYADDTLLLGDDIACKKASQLLPKPRLKLSLHFTKQSEHIENFVDNKLKFY